MFGLLWKPIRVILFGALIINITLFVLLFDEDLHDGANTRFPKPHLHHGNSSFFGLIPKLKHYQIHPRFKMLLNRLVIRPPKPFAEWIRKHRLRKRNATKAVSAATAAIGNVLVPPTKPKPRPSTKPHKITRKYHRVWKIQPAMMIHPRIKIDRLNKSSQVVPIKLGLVEAFHLVPSSIPPKSGALSVGPGEHGYSYEVDKNKLSGALREEYDRGWKDNGFNEFVSNRISVRRHLPDYRTQLCKIQQFSPNLPQASIVICFYNEAWSVLLRTIHSVIDNSPRKLLKEIVLIDDFSTKPYLKKPLEEYMNQLGIVRIIRNSKREGLIRARIIGTQHSRANIIVFLDSHVECTQGWLEPLLDRIAQNPTNVVLPSIELINDKTFKFEHIEDVQLGGFTWDLEFTWFYITQRRQNRSGTPLLRVQSPTMPGGLYAINRNYFIQLGMYDPEMQIWGGENLEMSFKIWMCGGNLEIDLCSHVGHLFRDRSPYASQPKTSSLITKNLIRLAEVWMDDYKQFFYDRAKPEIAEYGDITDRKLLRQRLQCKSFEWYLTNVYPELFIPSKAVAHGEIRNPASDLCADAPVPDDANITNQTVVSYPCHGEGGNQFWLMSRENQIRRDDYCWETDLDTGRILFLPCKESSLQQIFTYLDDGTIRQNDVCLQLPNDRAVLIMNRCDGSARQQWQSHRGPYLPMNLKNRADQSHQNQL